MQKSGHIYPVIDIKKTGKKIELYMRANHISVREMQEYLGLSCVQSIYRWFEGINMPSLDNLYAMSKLLRVSMDDLVCEKRQTTGRDALQRQCDRIIAYYMKVEKMLAV